MEEQNNDKENVEFTTLEDSDVEESNRQLRWTMVAFVVGLAATAIFYFLNE
jgi:hypothetical protein